MRRGNVIRAMQWALPQNSCSLEIITLIAKSEVHFIIDSYIKLYFFKLDDDFYKVSYNHCNTFSSMPNWYQLWCMSKCQSHDIVQHPSIIHHFDPAGWLVSKCYLKQITCLFLRINHHLCDKTWFLMFMHNF